MNRRLLLFIISLVIFVLPAGNAAAQPQIVENEVKTTYGVEIDFRIVLQSETPVESAFIFFQALNDTHTNIGPADVSPVGDQLYQIAYTHLISEYPLRAFSWVEYHFEAVLENGEVYRSNSFDFYYTDDRFEWKQLEEDPFRLFWYEGDIEFAQRILDTAQMGLVQLQSMLPLHTPETLDIYIYPDAESMLATLNPSSPDWVAGHADPDLGVIVVTIPDSPESLLLMEQRVPHELLHVLLYQATDLGYKNIPIWLREGLASLVELYPNPDYRVMLEHSIENDSLLPMASLCDVFPRDASGALRAYAQASSFTRYLFDTYGTSGISDLVTEYANGIECERGAKIALGKDLSQLDRQWRRDALEENVTMKAVTNLLPWLALLLALVLAPLLFAMTRPGRTQDKRQPDQTAAK